jgi:cytochrome c biogenesis protein CcmG/thiol:disulfide interchange protein DsbE
MKLNLWSLLPLGVFMALAAFFWRGLALDPHHLPSAQVGRQLPSFDLPGVLSSDQPHLTSALFQGHPSLLVVWASWCDACKQEQVFLFQLAKQGIALYGLNYKDDADSAKQWLSDWGNPYRAIGQDTQGQLAIELGVYGAPETYLIDAHGVIQYRHPGILSADVWQKEFVPRLAL